MRIIGNTVGMGLPKPNMMQNDPAKGDFVKGKDGFVDSTLTQPGLAADAKAVGDALGNISALLDSINGEVV